MLSWAALLLFLARCNEVVSTSDCHERCPVPVVNQTKDCPKFGFDCHRSQASLGLFSKSTSCDINKLKCADAKASLFVEGQIQRKLLCEKRYGEWKSSKCQQVKSALCAKSCVSCSRVVPNSISTNAVSISTIGGNAENLPCTIGFCPDTGLTLMGVDTKTNSTSTIIGNVTCTGDGWMDSRGKTYAYAVCAYYACTIPTTTSEPVTDPNQGDSTVPVVAIGTRMLTCPAGYFLSFTTPDGGTHTTQYSLICGASNKWTLFGIDIDAIDQISCFFQNYACSVDLASFPTSCTNGETGCVPPTSALHVFVNGVLNAQELVCDSNHVLYVVVAAAGSGPVVTSRVYCQGITLWSMEGPSQVTAVACRQYTDCSSSLPFGDGPCTSETTDCTTTVATTSSLSCANENATLFAQNKYVHGGHLTCTGSQSYVETGNPNFFHPSYAQCSTQKQLSCEPLPWLFTTDAIAYEYPPGATLGGITDVAISINYISSSPRLVIVSDDNTEFYINNDFSDYVWNLTCNSNGQWIASNGQVATTIGKFVFTNCPLDLPAITGVPGFSDSPTHTGTPDNALYKCSSGDLYYQIGSGTPVKINSGSSSGNRVNCAPNKQRMILDLQLMVPADTKFGCGPA